MASSSEPLYKTKSNHALARRSGSIPSEYLLTESTLSTLPHDLTTVPLTHTHFTASERAIVSTPAHALLDALRNRQYSSETVTRAFCKSAAVANQLTNCLTVASFDSAIARAKELDAHLAKTGTVVGPLHGLPISLKDCFVTPPLPSTVGLSAYAEVETQPAEESVLIRILHDAGAVIHAKTNVPVAMMMMETDNHIFGATTNPFNAACSPGGSSGGEGALIAMRGSPLGIGTDIGGSIRIPSAFCGLYSLKPSFGRLPTYGTRSGIPGNDFIFSVNGPMAHDIADLHTYCAALMGPTSQPWCRDPKVIPIPWRNDISDSIKGRKLRLAFMPPHDGAVHAHPPVTRALAALRRACRTAGHTVVDWPPQKHAEMLRTVQSGFLGLGGPAIAAKLAETAEPFMPGMQAYADAAAKDAQARTAGAIDHVLTADAQRAMNIKRNALQAEWLARWQDAKVDALIAPASPWSAVRRGFTTHRPGVPYYGYTAVFSLLDLAVGTLPMGRVRAVDADADDADDDDAWATERPQPFDELDAQIMDDWDPHLYANTPVGLQVVGERLGEEKVLGVVGELATITRLDA